MIRDWLFPGPFPSSEKTDFVRNERLRYSDGTYVPHGTAVLGKIAGSKTGLAQKAHVVVVKSTDINGNTDFVILIDAILKTYDHIVARAPANYKGFIVNLGLGFDPESFDWNAPRYKNNMKRMFKILIKRLVDLEKTILVTGAGNKRRVSLQTNLAIRD